MTNVERQQREVLRIVKDFQKDALRAGFTKGAFERQLYNAAVQLDIAEQAAKERLRKRYGIGKKR